MSSAHHSLQYIFFGILLVTISLIWIIVTVLQVTIPDQFVVPFGIMILGLAAITAALLWHRLTKG